MQDNVECSEQIFEVVSVSEVIKSLGNTATLRCRSTGQLQAPCCQSKSQGIQNHLRYFCLINLGLCGIQAPTILDALIVDGRGLQSRPFHAFLTRLTRAVVASCQGMHHAGSCSFDLTARSIYI